MNCNNCGYKNPSDARFCKKCGSKLNKVQSCWLCGKIIKKDVNFCPYCETKIDADKKVYLGARNKKRKIQRYIILVAVLSLAAAFCIVEYRSFDNIEKVETEAMTLFNNGLAPAFDGEKWGYIDETGQFVIKPQFEYAADFTEQKIAIVGKYVGENILYGYIDKKGKTIVPFEFDNMTGSGDPNLVTIRKNDKWGYLNLNEKGEPVIPPVYDMAFSFAENGLARVQMGEKNGFINKKGDLVIDAKFDKAGDFAANGLSCVKIDEKYGYIDETGEFSIFPQYDYARDFDENGLAIVSIEGREGCIDKDGNMVIDAVYDQMGGLVGQGALTGFDKEGLCPVRKDGKMGVINIKGEFVIPLEYTYVGYFDKEKMAAFCSDENPVNSKYGFINIKNEVVISAEYDLIGGFADNGLAMVCRGEKCGYIDRSGKMVIPMQYYNAIGFTNTGIASVCDENDLLVINSDNEVYLNLGNKEEAYCRDIQGYDDGYTKIWFDLVSKGGQYDRLIIFKDSKIVFDSDKC